MILSANLFNVYFRVILWILSWWWGVNRNLLTFQMFSINNPQKTHFFKAALIVFFFGLNKKVIEPMKYSIMLVQLEYLIYPQPQIQIVHLKQGIPFSIMVQGLSCKNNLERQWKMMLGSKYCLMMNANVARYFKLWQFFFVFQPQSHQTRRVDDQQHCNEFTNRPGTKSLR